MPTEVIPIKQDSADSRRAIVPPLLRDILVSAMVRPRHSQTIDLEVVAGKLKFRATHVVSEEGELLPWPNSGEAK